VVHRRKSVTIGKARVTRRARHRARARQTYANKYKLHEMKHVVAREHVTMSRVRVTNV